MKPNELSQDYALEFIMSGRAIFTVKSLKTGTRFTYKVSIADKADCFFVSVLTGSDNNSAYSPMCYIKIINGIPSIMRSTKTWISADAPSSIAFKYVFMNLLIRREMKGLEIWHEGRCCRCGRLLTVPESIEFGIGPECATKKRSVTL